MFDEEKVKKDLVKMREAYEKALKDIKDIEARQEEIAKKIYAIRERNKDKRKIWEE
jgi:archaellum component FlaC